jgi:hypothetical protein
MPKCKNCGHDSHCGIVLSKTIDNEDKSIEICKQCRCYRCTVKTDWG